MPREQFEYPLPSLPRLSHFGYSDSIRNNNYGPHYHYGYELIYVLRGTAETDLFPGERPVLLRQDDLCLISPGQVHEFIYRSEVIEFYWMGFQTGRKVAVAEGHMEQPARLIRNEKKNRVEFFEQIDREIENICLEIPCREGRLYRSVPQFAALFRDINGEIHRNDPYSGRLIYQKILEIFLQIARLEQAGEERKKTPELEFAGEYMRAHCREKVRIETLAGRVGYSQEHFTRVFKEHYGTTPKSYHDRLRSEAARKELNGGSSVGQTAAACGFSSSSHFSSWFRKQTGVPPEVYRTNSLPPA